MMRTLLALVIACGVAATAHAQTSVDGLDGWEPLDDELVQPQLDQLRGIAGTIDATGRAWSSPDSQAQAALIEWTYKQGTPSRKLLLGIERGAVSGQRRGGTAHVSDDAHFEGDMLVAQSTDQIDADLLHAARRYVVDASGVIHVAMLVCTGQGEWVSSCEAAQRTLRPAAEAVAIPEGAGAGLTPYELGRITGMLGAAAVLAWLVWRYARGQR